MPTSCPLQRLSPMALRRSARAAFAREAYTNGVTEFLERCRMRAGSEGFQYALVVTDLNQALASINRVLQECSVTAVSFNFKKRAGHYRVWFNLLVPKETNVKVIQRLSEVPEITQVETGSSARDFAQVMAPTDGEDGDRIV